MGRVLWDGKAVLATIADMIERGGLRADDVAEKLGCDIRTLRVRCSQAKISLRAPGNRRVRRRRDEHTIRVSGAALSLLRNRAAASEKPKQPSRGSCSKSSREMIFTTQC
jgi:hypothetical protein